MSAALKLAFAPVLLAGYATVLYAPATTADVQEQATRTVETRMQIEDLLASGPAPAHAAELQLFGQFVGDWKLRAETYADGKTHHSTGRMHMGWVLYGTALQDVWRSDTTEDCVGCRPKSFGTTLRFFDHPAGTWRSVWVSPSDNLARTFTAAVVDEEIVLAMDGRNPDGTQERWVWSNYTADKFEWRAEKSGDDGRTWNVIQRIWGVRRTHPSRQSSRAAPLGVNRHWVAGDLGDL